jgi:hypothetical protein
MLGAKIEMPERGSSDPGFCMGFRWTQGYFGGPEARKAHDGVTRKNKAAPEWVLRRTHSTARPRLGNPLLTVRKNFKGIAIRDHEGRSLDGDQVAHFEFA